MKLPKPGPALLVTAAFIGPGTVITASKAGADYGHSLIWALVFSVIATLILQEMAARLGVVTHKGLGENIRSYLIKPWQRTVAILMVTSAIVIGNAAYQSGNIMGAVLAVSPFTPFMSFTTFSLWPVIIGALAMIILWRGKYSLIETSLKLLVGLMSLAFIMTFIITKPDILQMLSGLVPRIPSGATLNVIALVGTTVVPYNLFLHAASASEKWQDKSNTDANLMEARQDLRFSISIGGLISIAILSTAASAFFERQIELHNLASLAPSLEPLLGSAAPAIMAAGLFAAGISSAITAPLAAAFALRGILGLDCQMHDWPFRLIWLIILILGVVIATLGMRPVNVIWFAQVANGLLLPIITIFLLWVMNSASLGKYKNNFKQNALGFLVLAVTLLLSGRSLLSAFGLI